MSGFQPNIIRYFITQSDIRVRFRYSRKTRIITRGILKTVISIVSRETEVLRENEQEVLEIKRHCNKNKKCLWWANQYIGHGEAGLLEFEDIKRNFQNWAEMKNPEYKILKNVGQLQKVLPHM